jgi:hypothetical protein
MRIILFKDRDYLCNLKGRGEDTRRQRKIKDVNQRQANERNDMFDYSWANVIVAGTFAILKLLDNVKNLSFMCRSKENRVGIGVREVVREG